MEQRAHEGAAAYGVNASHTTVPTASTITLDPHARHHVVAASPAGASVTALADAWTRSGTGSMAVLHTAATPPLPPEVSVEPIEQECALEQAVAERLAHASVGVRLYVTGAEGFVRRVVAQALAGGLQADEIHSEVDAASGRRVWCSHCKRITEEVTTANPPCAGCGRTLEVYHHFSRRHGAYMGFQADAETPGVAG